MNERTTIHISQQEWDNIVGWMHKSHVSMLPLEDIQPWPEGCERLHNIVAHLLEQAASRSFE